MSGLPKLNGLAGACQIRVLAPNAKIMFVSQESSADAVQEAFHIGAEGYLMKTDAIHLTGRGRHGVGRQAVPQRGIVRQALVVSCS